MWMRGGTSKGLYFLKEDIPSNKKERDNFLLSVFGSPDTLQINGIGGGTPLHLKVAIVSKSKNQMWMSITFFFRFKLISLWSLILKTVEIFLQVLLLFYRTWTHRARS